MRATRQEITEAKRVEAEWETAGIDAHEVFLPFMQPLPEAVVYVPGAANVRLVGPGDAQQVAWRGGGREKNAKGCLAAFLRLAEEGSENNAVKGFVSRWGALQIFPHQWTNTDATLVARLQGKAQAQDAGAWIMETPKVYFHVARQLKGIHNIAMRLKAGDEKTRAEDWYAATLNTGDSRFGGPDYRERDGTKKQVSLTQQKARFAYLVSEYLIRPAYLPTLRWGATVPPRLTIETSFYTALGDWQARLSRHKIKFVEQVQLSNPNVAWREAEVLFHSSEAYSKFLTKNPCPSHLLNILRLQTIAALTSEQEVIPCGVPGCEEVYEGKRRFISDPTKNRCPKHKGEATNASHRRSYYKKKATG